MVGFGRVLLRKKMLSRKRKRTKKLSSSNARFSIMQNNDSLKVSQSIYYLMTFFLNLIDQCQVELVGVSETCVIEIDRMSILPVFKELFSLAATHHRAIMTNIFCLHAVFRLHRCGFKIVGQSGRSARRRRMCFGLRDRCYRRTACLPSDR